MRYDGLKVTMKSYVQVLRSLIDPNFGKHLNTSADDEDIYKKLSTLRVQVTNKRLMTLKLTPTS